MSALTPLEVASGLVLGLEPKARIRENRRPPLAALEDAIRPALERAPCLVSFSGGRDSSAILATAAALARREGLPLPIPATNRFPEIPEADETSWQERVVLSLGLTDWVRLEFGSELDCVGPVATAAMRKHGLLFPCNAHFHGPLLAAASTGSLLTGIGGDELFTTRPRAALVVAGTVRPRPRDILRLGLALAPPFARSAVLRRRDRTNLPWLTESADRAVSSAWSRFAATEPLRWRAHLSWCSRLRYLRLGARSLELLAADHDVLLIHPLTDPGFLGSCAHRPLARVDRAATMEALFGGLLPPEVLGRSTKASFDGAFFGSHSRAFASAWDGTGADRAHVDADWLRGSWLSGAPVAQTFTQLQAAWLASSGVERAEQLVDPALEAVPAGGTPVLPGR